MKTDSQFQQDVLAELNWAPVVRSAQIGVEVKRGDVMLTGAVHSRAERHLATRSAWDSSGVHQIADKVTRSD